MSKFFYAFTALLALQAVDSVAAQSTPNYLPLENPGAAKCIVKGAFNKDESFYALKLGSCTDKSVAQLNHVGKGKEIRTADKYCLAPLTDSAKPDVEIVLRKCPAKITANGLKWTKVGRSQWQNGNKLCMEYVSKTKKFVQKKCATLAAGDKSSPQQWVFKAPPSIKCADWGKKWVCGSGWTLNTQSGLTCVGATDASCANVCCMKVKTCASEGQTKCPNGYRFQDRQCGNPGQPKCDWPTCCVPNTTCKSAGYTRCPADTMFVDRQCSNPGQPRCSYDVCCQPLMTCSASGFRPNKCPTDYTFTDRQCGNPGQPACTWQTCCVYNPKPIKCSQWDSCSRDFVLKPNAKNIWCARAQGSSYPQCSDRVCCDKNIAETTCGRWNQCESGFEVKPNAYNKRCYVKVGGASGLAPASSPGGNSNEWCSNTFCCAPKKPEPPAPVATTCGKWDSCDDGYEVKPDQYNKRCYVPGGPASADGSRSDWCSNRACCAPKRPTPPPEPEATTCGRWNSCNNGYELQPNANNKRCYVRPPASSTGADPASAGRPEWCSNDFCCQESKKPEPPIDCKQWNGKCSASNGYVLNNRAKDIACHTDPSNVVEGPSYAPLCGEDICCVQDTCKEWSDRVVDTDKNLTGADVCAADPAKYAGLMDKNDSRFDQPCKDQDGNNIACKPELCCLQAIVPISDPVAPTTGETQQ